MCSTLRNSNTYSACLSNMLFSSCQYMPVIVGLLFFLGCSDSGNNTEPISSPQQTQQTEKSADPIEDSPGEMVMPDQTSQQASEPDVTASAGSSIEMPLPEERANTDSKNSRNPEGSFELEYGSWEVIRNAAKNRGKVTVVDLWSLACEPCLKEFPGLVQLKRDFSDQLECLSVNLDFDGRKTRPPEFYEKEIVEFLQSVKAEAVVSYVCTTASDDVFIEEKLPSIPVVLVFDQKGTLVKRFVDSGETVGFTYQNDVRPVIEELLADQ